jgi:hypothetical protein
MILGVIYEPIDNFDMYRTLVDVAQIALEGRDPNVYEKCGRLWIWLGSEPAPFASTALTEVTIARLAPDKASSLSSQGLVYAEQPEGLTMGRRLSQYTA